MKKSLPLALSITIAALGLALIALPATPAGNGGAAEARKLFEETHKCNMCHGAAAAGIEAKTKAEKMLGPDLSGFASKKSLDQIAGYVRKQAALDGKSHMKEFKGTDEELQTILDWLGSLEAQK